MFYKRQMIGIDINNSESFFIEKFAFEFREINEIAREASLFINQSIFKVCIQVSIGGFYFDHTFVYKKLKFFTLHKIIDANFFCLFRVIVN